MVVGEPVGATPVARGLGIKGLPVIGVFWATEVAPANRPSNDGFEVYP